MRYAVDDDTRRPHGRITILRGDGMLSTGCARGTGGMYEAFFQLMKRPFSATPDDACFFISPGLQETLRQLELALGSGQGVSVLIAAAGMGKTLLCRKLLHQLKEHHTPVYLGAANFPTRKALLQSILYELGQRYSGLDEQELWLDLQAALKQKTAANRGVLLILDEAHLCSDRVLDEIRALASLSSSDGPLCRVLLCGQPRLEERLADGHGPLEALNQRICCHEYIEPLSRQESLDYLQYRVQGVGGSLEKLFEPEALPLIAQACNGIPRLINQLCDHCLLVAYIAETPLVSRAITEEALTALKQLPLNWSIPLGVSSRSGELVESSHPEASDSTSSDSTDDLPALEHRPLESGDAESGFPDLEDPISVSDAGTYEPTPTENFTPSANPSESSHAPAVFEVGAGLHEQSAHPIGADLETLSNRSLSPLSSDSPDSSPENLLDPSGLAPQPSSQELPEQISAENPQPTLLSPSTDVTMPYLDGQNTGSLLTDSSSSCSPFEEVPVQDRYAILDAGLPVIKLPIKK